MKLSWLLSVAERVKSVFASTAESDQIVKIIRSEADSANAIVAHNMVVCDGYNFMILCKDPHQLFIDIIDTIKSANDSKFQSDLNPSNILPILVNSEYRFDVGGTRLCCGIKSPIPSNYLMKAIACRNIASAQAYNNLIDQESFVLLKEKVQELDPLFDYSTNTSRVIGGKKPTFMRNQKQNGRERIDIIARLVEYVRNNKHISCGVIFVDELDNCTSSAINILYTEYKYKEAITDFLKLLIANKYSKYSFKSFLHSDFSIPSDFRLKKYSCLINDKVTQKAIYIANLYNSATYDVIPCTRSIINDTVINITHPIIRLRMLYIDMYMIERKIGKIHPTNHERLYINKMTKAFHDTQTYDKYPTWIGYFIDENYDKLQVNMRSKEPNMVDTVYI
jgi:hypothetical protein